MASRKRTYSELDFTRPCVSDLLTIPAGDRSVALILMAFVNCNKVPTSDPGDADDNGYNFCYKLLPKLKKNWEDSSYKVWGDLTVNWPSFEFQCDATAFIAEYQHCVEELIKFILDCIEDYENSDKKEKTRFSSKNSGAIHDALKKGIDQAQSALCALFDLDKNEDYTVLKSVEFDANLDKDEDKAMLVSEIMLYCYIYQAVTSAKVYSMCYSVAERQLKK